MDVINSAPDEILAEILHSCLQDTNDAKNVSLTCKRWSWIVNLIVDKSPMSVAKLMAFYLSEEDDAEVTINVVSSSMEKFNLYITPMDEDIVYASTDNGPKPTYEIRDNGHPLVYEVLIYTPNGSECNEAPCSINELFHCVKLKNTLNYYYGALEEDPYHACISIPEMEKMLSLSPIHKDTGGGIYLWMHSSFNYKNNPIFRHLLKYGEKKRTVYETEKTETKRDEDEVAHANKSEKVDGRLDDYLIYVSWDNMNIALNDRDIKRYLLFKKITYTIEAIDLAMKRKPQ